VPQLPQNEKHPKQVDGARPETENKSYQLKGLCWLFKLFRKGCK